MFFFVQPADGPSPGSFELRMFPSPSPATQSETAGHEMACSGAPWPAKGLPSTFSVPQTAEGPAPGSVELTTFPEELPSTQRASAAHDTTAQVMPGSTGLAVQPAAGPAVGLVEVRTLPSLSTAAHSVTEGHEMPDSGLRSTRLVVQVAETPAAGFSELTVLPASSTATHRDTDGHDKSVKNVPGW